MKVIMKPIDMICSTTSEGKINPIRFRFLNNNAYTVVKINRTIDIKQEKLAGKKMYIFIVQSIINHVERKYEIKYSPEDCKWYLYKF